MDVALKLLDSVAVTQPRQAVHGQADFKQPQDWEKVYSLHLICPYKVQASELTKLEIQQVFRYSSGLVVEDCPPERHRSQNQLRQGGERPEDEEGGRLMDVARATTLP